MAYLDDVMAGCGRFLMRAQLPIAMVGALGLPSCSFAFANPPPRAPETRKPSGCEVKRGLALADMGLFGVSAAVGVADAVGTDARNDRASTLLVDGVVAALFLGSAVYGLNKASQCEAERAPYDSTRPALRREPLPDYTHRSTPPAGPADTTLPGPSAAPTGGAGFEFGQSLEVATARCGELQGRWSADPYGPACIWSGGQNSVRVGLDFCPAGPEAGPPSLCRIVYEVSPQTIDADVWRRLITSLEAQMRSRFGPSPNRHVQYPEACKAADKFYQCMVDGQLSFEQSWQWINGQRVTLHMGGGGTGGRPSVRVFSATGAHTAAVSSPAPAMPAR